MTPDEAPALTTPTTPTYETGVFLGVNALPDAAIVLNSPRCSFVRSLKVALGHDRASTLYDASGRHRVITTEWARLEDVTGAEERFLETLARVSALTEARHLVAYQNISSFVTGFDLEGLAAEASARLGRRIVTVPGPLLDKDWLDGYRAAVRPFEEQALASVERTGEGALVLGNLHTRGEWDDLASEAELRRLLEALGLGPVAVFPSGHPLPERTRARHVLALPYTSLAGRDEVTPTPLPVGLAGTSEWLRHVGGATGREREAEALVRRELAEVAPLLRWPVLETLSRRAAVVVADPVLGPALCAALQELGVDVPALFATSRRAPAAPAGVVVHAHASLETFDETLAALRAEGRLDAVVGSGVFGDVPALDGVPHLEVGFPSLRRHAIHPAPLLGYAGIRWLADALVNLTG